MAFNRQIFLCWLLAGLFMVSAALLYIRPRWESEPGPYGRMAPTIDCAWNFFGKRYGIVQVDKGARPPEQHHWTALPRDMWGAMYFLRIKESNKALVMEPHSTGARRTVAAVFVAGRGYMLPMRIDGMLLACGVVVAVVTAGLSVRLKRMELSALAVARDDDGRAGQAGTVARL